jgi:hypothetical protein
MEHERSGYPLKGALLIVSRLATAIRITLRSRRRFVVTMLLARLHRSHIDVVIARCGALSTPVSSTVPTVRPYRSLPALRIVTCWPKLKAEVACLRVDRTVTFSRGNQRQQGESVSGSVGEKATYTPLVSKTHL